MAPNPKITKACKAMKVYGIPEKTVKPVLKNLLNLYEKNWVYIEEDNYKVLMDAIFDSEKPKREEIRREESCSKNEQKHEPPLKRYRLRSQTCQNHSSPRMNVESIHQCLGGMKTEPTTASQLVHYKRKGQKTCSPQEMGQPQPSQLFSNDKKTVSNFADDLGVLEVPLAVIHPAPSSLLSEDGSLHANCSDGKENGSKFPEFVDLNAEDKSPPSLVCEGGSSNVSCSNYEGNDLKILESKHLEMENKEDNAPDSSEFEIASSSKGEVKISLICNSSLPSDVHTQNLNAILKAVEKKCIASYQITEPGFSLSELMKDVCDIFVAESTSSNSTEKSKPVNVPTSLNVRTEVRQQSVLGPTVDLSYGSVKVWNLIEILPQIPRFMASDVSDFLDCVTGLKVNGSDYCGSSNSSSMVTVQQNQSSLDLPSSLYYVDDITRGEENRKISLVNEITNECQPSFTYIPQNIPYRNAYVKFPLARISDENCCSNCFGDCLSILTPCACAGETGGEFAYTKGGVVKENFLEKCISMNRDPQNHHLFYCKDCPLERSKDESLSGECEGHLMRNFIKECWYKCGCGINCGNRVVQRGITANLQVFMTPDGKGWGLRTLEDLPKGAFVCEYVGEIVTNTELFDRNMHASGERHTYPVLLDAAWGSEVVVKDEEALCLDATFFGNVARFVNHRCCDANLVEIPVEVETPEHHYYHLAFFTTRKVDALEELTWDYGIDFDDHSHPVKAFQCRCGSKFCRNIKRRKKKTGSGC